MSWSKSATGTHADIRAAMAGWASEVLAVDTQYTQIPLTTELHQTQVTAALAVADHFLESRAEDPEYGQTISANGHGSATTERVISDSMAVTVSYYKKAVVST